jgi:hypothetical protein
MLLLISFLLLATRAADPPVAEYEWGRGKYMPTVPAERLRLP